MSSPPQVLTATESIVGVEDAASVVSTSSSKEKDSSKPREQMTLPPGFEPSSTDVIIGRGKRARTHQGNLRLRGLIDLMIGEYSNAGNNKDEKSYIIKEIVVSIRKSSPLGGFVKFDKATSRWVEVGDFYAREKISQTFRDAMGDTYSSSNPYKRKRRSFEKNNHASMDVTKRLRGSSPTSVLQPGSGTSTPTADASTSPSPEPGMPMPSLLNGVVSGASAAATAANQAAANAMMKRPGQIGFARRSSLLFGLPGAPPPPMPMHQFQHRPPYAAPHYNHALLQHHHQMAAAAHRRLSVGPAATTAGGGGSMVPPSYHHSFYSAAGVPPPRRVSMPGSLYSPYPPTAADTPLVSRRVSSPQASSSSSSTLAAAAAPNTAAKAAV